MAEHDLQGVQAGDKGTGSDLVMGFSPREWPKANQEEKAVLALAPMLSLAMLLDDGESTMENVPNVDVARVLKALVDRAEMIFGIPGQGVTGTAKEVNHG